MHSTKISRSSSTAKSTATDTIATTVPYRSKTQHQHQYNYQSSTTTVLAALVRAIGITATCTLLTILFTSVRAEAFTPLSKGHVHLRKRALLPSFHYNHNNNNPNNNLLNNTSKRRTTLLHSSSSSTTSTSETTPATASATTMSSATSSTNPLPNWRVFPLDYDESNSEENSNHKPSPFQPSSSSSSPWSKEQYQKALEQYDIYNNSQDTYIAPLLQNALQTLLHAYRLYGPENVIGSFNGGKDAVVIMELMRAAHAKYYHDLLFSSGKVEKEEEEEKGDNDNDSDGNGDMTMIRPRVIYFNHKLEFPRVYDFVRDTVRNYDLEMIAFEEHISFVQGLDILVKRNTVDTNASSTSTSTSTKTNIPMSFVLGTRKTDPNAGNQGSFAPSSTWMPPFMRVNPILDWTYGHTWHFLRLFKIPYCSLYDEGYTSLGNVEDTLPCPALLKVQVGAGDSISGGDDDDLSSCKYWPAYMLKDWDQERAGRVKKEKKKKGVTKDKDANKKDDNDGDDSGNDGGTLSESPSTVSFLKVGESIVTSNSSTNQNQQQLPLTAPNTIVSSTEQLPKRNNSDNTKEADAETLSSATTATQRSVGLLIIGDEILKGLTPDTNTHVAASALEANNVPLAKVSVVSDDLAEIVREIEYMTSLVDVIITSGGVGPTHDDVTIKSVGKALGSKMILNRNMAELLQRKMNTDGEGELPELTPAQIKMATLPECSKLRYLSSDKNDWPVLQCSNIFILPGVPAFFSKKVELVANYLSTELERSVVFKVVLSIDESSIVPILNNVVKNHPNVSFGSYPFVDHPEYKTVVTLEGRKVEGGTFRNSSKFLSFDIDDEVEDKEFEKNEIDLNVKVALADLVNGMPEGSVLRVDNNNDLTFN